MPRFGRSNCNGHTFLHARADVDDDGFLFTNDGVLFYFTGGGKGKKEEKIG